MTMMNRALYQNLPPNPEKVNPYKTGADLSCSKSLHWENKGLSENYYMLGYGFDATGKYAIRHG